MQQNEFKVLNFLYFVYTSYTSYTSLSRVKDFYKQSLYIQDSSKNYFHKKQ